MSCNDHNISLFAFFTHLDELRTLPPIHEDLRKICNVPMLGKLLAMASPTEAVYWLRAIMYIWAPANLLCLLGVLIRPGKCMLQRATRKLKVLEEEFVQVPIQSYTHLTHCSRRRQRQLQPAFTKWLHLTGVAKCAPEAGKCVKETPLKPLQPLQPLHFIDSIRSDAQITCVYWNPSDSSSPENLWSQHHLGHLKSLRAQGLRSRVKHLAGHAARHPRHPAVTAKMPLGHIHHAT